MCLQCLGSHAGVVLFPQSVQNILLRPKLLHQSCYPSEIMRQEEKIRLLLVGPYDVTLTLIACWQIQMTSEEVLLVLVIIKILRRDARSGECCLICGGNRLSLFR